MPFAVVFKSRLVHYVLIYFHVTLGKTTPCTFDIGRKGHFHCYVCSMVIESSSAQLSWYLWSMNSESKHFTKWEHITETHF